MKKKKKEEEEEEDSLSVGQGREWELAPNQKWEIISAIDGGKFVRLIIYLVNSFGPAIDG